MMFLRMGRIDVVDGAFVVIDERGIRKQVPVGSLACLLLEPGTRITHAAIRLAAQVGCLILWVGEAGVRLYSAGQPGGSRSDKLLHQARLVLDDQARLKVVRKMYSMRFGTPAPKNRSVEQLRGIEGARVRELYRVIAAEFGVEWKHRSYNPNSWEKADPLNRALSAATSSLYGLCEAAVLAAGYSPAIGFIHTGKPRSFVYDIADLYKFQTVVPAAFREFAIGPVNIESRVRRRCRDSFRAARLLRRIIPSIEEVLHAGELDPPARPPESVGPAFEDPEGIGDAGHRH